MGVVGGRSSSVPSKLLLVSQGDDDTLSVVGNNKRGSRNSNIICSLFLMIVATFSSTITFYYLGRHIATIVPYNDVSSTAENDAPIITTASSSSPSSSRLVINTANTPKLDQVLLRQLAESTPFIRGQVINTIMERFTARNPLTASRIDRLSDAFDAIEYLEDDGEAIQVDGHPFLFVGSIGKQT